MHTETESAHERLAATASILPAAGGLGLYFLTLTGEAMLGAGARWLLIYLGAATAGAIVPLGLSAGGLAWAAAFAPLLWSLLGLFLPGGGLVWRRRLGARRPTGEEVLLLADAFALLRGSASLRGEPIIYVLDDPLPAAAVRGKTLILSRGLLESDSLAPVLAHELGHSACLDGRLTEALARLVIWRDPLGPAQPAREPGEIEFAPEHGGGLLWSAARWVLRLSGGGCAEQLLSPAWAAYWRSREYAADGHAADLGQAEDLLSHLADFEQAFDVPQRGLLIRTAEHPPVARRIERLQSLALGGGSK